MARGKRLDRVPDRSSPQGEPWASDAPPPSARGEWASLLTTLTTRVGSLDRGNPLIGERNGRTAMPLFAYEIEFRSRRVAIKTRLLQFNDVLSTLSPRS
jgi:hypothetical protein